MRDGEDPWLNTGAAGFPWLRVLGKKRKGARTLPATVKWTWTDGLILSDPLNTSPLTPKHQLLDELLTNPLEVRN
jgi:hypothetical protein